MAGLGEHTAPRLAPAPWDVSDSAWRYGLRPTAQN